MKYSSCPCVCVRVRVCSGDGIDDLQSGRAAGSTAILIKNSENTHLELHADHSINALDELIDIIAQSRRRHSQTHTESPTHDKSSRADTLEYT